MHTANAAHRCRFWDGGYSAACGRLLSHSGSGHLLPSSGCGLQWICHLRYSHLYMRCLHSHMSLYKVQHTQYSLSKNMSLFRF